MQKPCAAGDTGDSTVVVKDHHFPIEVFERFSREELLIFLTLMHRILEADRRCDVERIAAELPMLLTNHTDTGDVCRDNQVTEKILAEYPQKSADTYHLLTYFYSCLSRVQTKINSPHVSRVASARNPYHLSPREVSVLSWMKEGKTNWEIARILGLSERTVRFHARSIFERLDVTSRTQAVVRGLGAGLIVP